MNNSTRYVGILDVIDGPALDAPIEEGYEEDAEFINQLVGEATIRPNAAGLAILTLAGSCCPPSAVLVLCRVLRRSIRENTRATAANVKDGEFTQQEAVDFVQQDLDELEKDFERCAAICRKYKNKLNTYTAIETAAKKVRYYDERLAAAGLPE